MFEVATYCSKSVNKYKTGKNVNQLDAKCKCLQFQFIGKHDYN